MSQAKPSATTSLQSNRSEVNPRFMLRRTLFPWKVEETLAEAARFAQDYGVDEIIWKIDAEEFSHGLPTLERISSYLPWLKASRQQLDQIGVSMSINPWVTMGMRDAGWDLRKVHPEFEWLTDITGVQARSQACPLNPAWRKWIGDAYAMYAGVGPRVVWIEDDIRVIRHRPVYYSCYCPRHLAEFSRMNGKTWTREALAEEILRPGNPSPVRAAWLNFLGGVIAEVLEQLSQRIRQVDPRVRLGLMCSAPPMHAAETRDWDRVLAAVAGEHEEVIIRPGMGNYQEWTPRGLYETRQYVGSTLACVRRPVKACGEVENWPFTRFSKSVKFSRGQVLLGMALQCSSLTFNAYDHLGTALEVEPGYGRMLKEIRPRVEALAEAYRPGGMERGIGMLHHEQGPHFKRLNPAATFANLFMGAENWADSLQAMGLPVTWRPSDVVAVSGPKLQAYAGQLDQLFARGVLLDASAAQAVQEMGRGELLGVKVKEIFARKEREIPAEQLIDAEFGQSGLDYMTVDHVGLEARVAVLEAQAGARVVSKLVNADRQPVLNGLTLFENALGGRVAVYPYDFAGEMPTWFLNWHRQRQLQAVARWLFRGKLPLSVGGGAWPLGIRTDYPDYTLVSVMNLSLDDWPGVEIELEGKTAPVQRLGNDGKWTKLSGITHQGTKIAWHDSTPLGALELATYRVG